MPLRRARSLESWLGGLIAAYQDRNVRPRHRTFSNLTHLRKPTQMYAMSVRHGNGHLSAIVLAHRKQEPNGVCRAVSLDNLEELAKFSGSADDYFGTRDIVRDDQLPDVIVVPETGVAAQALLLLAASLRSHLQPPTISPGTFRVDQQRMLQTVPPGALWLTTYRKPLPSHREVLVALGRPPRRAPKAAVSAPQPSPLPSSDSAEAFAAYAEPTVWFGQPPFPSTKERILSRATIWSIDEPLLHRGTIAGVETFVYNGGRVLAATKDASAAQATINQVFAVLDRSGVASQAVPLLELVSIGGFNRSDGTSKTSKATVTPRNRLLGMRDSDGIGAQTSLQLPEDVLKPLLELADACAQDHDMAQQSLRLLSATSLLRGGSHTEAFVSGWTLVERYLQRGFESFWAAQGRSGKAIKDMDWTAAQQADLLLAVGVLLPKVSAKVHALRKRRNAIVHDLQSASEAEATECIGVAAQLNPLPAFPKKLTPRMVFL